MTPSERECVEGEEEWARYQQLLEQGSLTAEELDWMDRMRRYSNYVKTELMLKEWTRREASVA